MQKKYLILRNSKNDYFFSSIAKQYNVYSVYSNRIEKFVYNHKTCVLFKSIYSLFNWRKFRQLDFVIFFDYGYNHEAVEYIKHHNPNCKICVFFFNKITNNKHFEILEDKLIDEKWSFDPLDCQKYNLKFNTPMYVLPKIIDDNNSICRDILFVGAPKQRIDDLNRLKEECDKESLTSLFLLPTNQKEYIKYMDYIKLVMESICIVDITNPGQKGLSLRFMEALFYQKKIITNNLDVINYNFYNSSNIYIIGIDKISISDFINVPFEKYDSCLIEYYSMNSWIERFLL